MRREHHLPPGVTRKDGSHDGEAADLSPDIRLSTPRWLVGRTPRLSHQHLEFGWRYRRKLALPEVGYYRRTEAKATC